MFADTDPTRWGVADLFDDVTERYPADFFDTMPAPPPDEPDGEEPLHFLDVIGPGQTGRFS
jgi:hypothetical protein